MSTGEEGSTAHSTSGLPLSNGRKKEKRALSFANAHRPAQHHQHQQYTRLARAMPPLTPTTIQDIIGTVLPINITSSPRIQLSSPLPHNPPSTSHAHALSSTGAQILANANMDKISSRTNVPSSPTDQTISATDTSAPSIASPTSTAASNTVPPIESKSMSPSRQAKIEQQQHTREPSIKSERSYFTSSTAFSDSAVDPVFSPQLGHGNMQDVGRESSGQDTTTFTTTSVPYPSNVDLDTSIASPRLTQSEETTRNIKSPSPEPASEPERVAEGEEVHSTTTTNTIAPSMQRDSSHHRITVKPALFSRGKSSASSTRLSKSALLQRTQSAKSVRIIESPTEADGNVLEGTSGETGIASNTTSHRPPPHHHTAQSVRNVKNSHIAPKRTISSTRLKGHTRNSSSASLHREGRIKTPPPILETPSPDITPAAPDVVESSPSIPPSTTATTTTTMERHEMQAAPHVTKAINIRRNNSSLANLIQTEPRSVSRGFAVPSSSSNGDSNGTSHQHQQDSQQQHENGVSSPSSTAVAAATVQSVPDTTPSLHPPPPSPASPVVMVPCSVVLPPQPRSSPADPRFRIHSTIRRPRSPPPLVEEEQDSQQQQQQDRKENVVNAHSRSDDDMNSRVKSDEQRKKPKTPKRSETLPSTRSKHSDDDDDDDDNETAAAKTSSTTAPRDMKPEPQQLTNAKKKQMFFFSSPTTDSDDEGGHNGSFKLRLASVLPNESAPVTTATPGPAQAPGPAKITSVNEKAETVNNTKEKQSSNGKSTEEKQNGSKNINEGDHDDDEYEDADEDDSDEWSSEASESEEDEHQAAIRREEERQRLMFAKRTPSMVATQGGLLSKLLRPEAYDHGSANMPAHLRNNASAMHLNQLPNIGSTAGIERARASHNLFTVTGLLASKSTAALPDLRAATRQEGSSRLIPSKSGNHLTRLGGAPSGVELESDDDDDEDELAKEISPTQQKKLSALMQRTTSSRARARDPSSSPPLQRTQENPTTEVSRITSAAQLANSKQPEPTSIFTPRTTRRNMLSTELTESLRASLLAERNKNRPGAAGGIGRIVSAVGNRLGVRQQQHAPTPQQPQRDSAPSQIEFQSAHQSSSTHLRPPRIQRGVTGFTPANLDGSAVDRRRPSAVAASRPPPQSRANSDPPQQTEYYSPGFHHT